MAEIAGGFLGPVLEVVRWVGAPIQRQFNYLCCFTTNITNLKNEAKKLQDTDGDLQLKVDAAKRDVQIIYSEVNTWLENSKNIKDEADGILKEVRNVEGGCLNLTARFSLSKRAKKTADRLKELRDQCEFDTETIGQPGPPAAMNLDPSPATLYEFQSRKKIEQDIMATLREGDVNMMGICGMGGLGKTTMAKKIKNRALGEHVFDEVAMAVVSQPIDKLKIQDEIGGSLGLKLQGECSEARVQKLHARLSGTKRILLVLDDVWEELVLEDLGIPSSYKGCTILLTSRNHDVLSAMNVQKIFGMKVLSEEDSWIMFRERVGTCVDNTELNSLARKVVNECKGLPLALTTVGAALKDEVDVKAWKNAVGRLEKGDPDIPKFIAKVYSPLKLSYDVLEPKYQDVFLLCCVYPEDAHIPLEQLTYCCMGLCIATGTVEEARNRIWALTKVLKNRSLLLDSEKGDEYVRMHDVVRDVCIFIAKQKGYIGDNDLTPSLQRYKLHSGFELLQIRNSSDVEINFDGITDLSVLSIERCSQLTSLPFTQRPNNLISSNSFQNLKILNLDDLPVLKQLWMSSQNDLGKDFLPQLEVLDIENCGMMETVFLWNGEDGNENTSCHHITKIFPKLKRIRIEECRKMKGMVWNENNWGGSSKASIQGLFCPREVSFSELEELIIIGCDSILSLFTSSMAGNLVNLKELSIGWCVEMVEVIKDDEEKGMSGGRQTALLFPKLQKLELWHLHNLLSFCESKGIESIQFPVLREMIIYTCGKMKGMVANGVTSNENNSGGSSTNAADIIHFFCQSKQVSFSELEKLIISRRRGILSLFTSSMAGNLVNLKALNIGECKEMVEVIKDDEEKGMSGGRQTALLFPKLQELELRNLPKLVSFCESKGIESIQFPKLHTLKLVYLPKLVSFGCLKKLDTDRNSFSELEELKIFGCQSILSLFTSSMAGNLVNLKELRIGKCDEMVEVIEEKEEEKEKVVSGAQRTTILFPKLHKIQLLDLPELVRFCEWKCDVELPSLTEVEITGCHKMKSCTAGLLTTPNLKSVKIDYEKFGEVKDLNGLVQQQYLRRAEETIDVATQMEAPAAAAK